MAGQFTWLGCDERQNLTKSLHFLIESLQNSADYDVERKTAQYFSTHYYHNHAFGSSRNGE